jgi:Domain of unknown function (DUF5615)
MARLYADEQFPRVVSELLCTMGHDVLTVQEAGNANQKVSDDEGVIEAKLRPGAISPKAIPYLVFKDLIFDRQS